ERGQPPLPRISFAGAERGAGGARVAAGCRFDVLGRGIGGVAHDGLVAAGAGDKVAGQTDQAIILEQQADTFLLAGVMPRLHAVQVIPADRFEGVLGERGAQEEAHLEGGNAGAQLVHHFLGNDVALLNVDLVHAGESATGKAGAGGTKYQDTKGTVQTIWHRVVTSTIESLLNGPESYPTDPALRSIVERN